ncbi:MAG: hypothetical protein DWQ07_00015 [Chloroflexi bacterium]|nr:MAG: hypothetical protein DWQ07_00015 [Chloroflexota bacterium]MBL1196053.1 hypothetical protein [Chloroflexota bacterium]
MLLSIIILLLAACSGETVEKRPEAQAVVDEQLDAAPTLEEAVEVPLENLGPAPELENEVWLNTDAPLRLANLRGQVVLLDMWTFG